VCRIRTIGRRALPQPACRTAYPVRAGVTSRLCGKKDPGAAQSSGWGADTDHVDEDTRRGTTDDATIRAALRDLGVNSFTTPRGNLRVRLDDLAARGITRDEGKRWVEAHGGHVERQLHRKLGLRASYGGFQVFESLIVPEDALVG
jgi:hypothetical protein